MDAEAANVLPRRNPSRSPRPRPGGRHRSPDRLSVPRAAPALVLAVPALESADTAEIAAGVISVAGTLCPGADIYAGFAGEGPAGLAAVLGSIVAARTGEDTAAQDGDGTGAGEPSPYAAVVIPLAITPDPGRDAAIADIVARAGPAVTTAAQLGPHPLLVAALHDRLAETGLVGQRRIAGLSLVTMEVGVLVAVTGGELAMQAAETAALLLTARLGVPVAPVRLGHGGSLANGVAALRHAGASRLVMAPYLIGPEIRTDELAAAARALTADCAPVLGAHPAIGQLVTMRYGAALLDQPPQGPATVAPLRLVSPHRSGPRRAPTR